MVLPSTPSGGRNASTPIDEMEKSSRVGAYGVLHIESKTLVKKERASPRRYPTLSIALTARALLRLRRRRRPLAARLLCVPNPSVTRASSYRTATTLRGESAATMKEASLWCWSEQHKANHYCNAAAK
jgi:hypothetical protein